jgi:tetratricopeptide (TPR) repeat protein
MFSVELSKINNEFQTCYHKLCFNFNKEFTMFNRKHILERLQQARVKVLKFTTFVRPLTRLLDKNRKVMYATMPVLKAQNVEKAMNIKQSVQINWLPLSNLLSKLINPMQWKKLNFSSENLSPTSNMIYNGFNFSNITSLFKKIQINHRNIKEKYEISKKYGHTDTGPGVYILKSYFKSFQEGLEAKEKRYKEWKEKNNPVDDLLRSLLQFVITVGAAEYFRESINNYKKLEDIALAIEGKVRENMAELEKMGILRIDPLFYLTTTYTKNEQDNFNKYRSFLIQRLNQLKDYKNELEQLKYVKITRKQEINESLEQEEKQIEFVLLFIEADRLQKNRKYEAALQKIEKVIEGLEGALQKYTREQENKFFFSNRMLAAAYNMQAKLQACLAFIDKTSNTKLHRSHSLASYNQAIGILEREKELSDLASLYSSKAYLLLDSCDDYDNPEEILILKKQALSLQKSANALKPSDPHILCGVGVAYYEIGKKSSQGSVDFKKLKIANKYLTRAIQINDNTPNIFVSRGKVSLEMSNIQEALEDFEKAIALDQFHRDANIHKALILTKQKRNQSTVDCNLIDKYIYLSLLPCFTDRPYEIKRQEKSLKEVLEELDKEMRLACNIQLNTLLFKFGFSSKNLLKAATPVNVAMQPTPSVSNTPSNHMP